MESQSTLYYEFVEQADDFPPAFNGVHYLDDNTTYVVTANVDLRGNRIIAGRNTTIIGGSSENCSITSTTLPATVPLISSEWSLPMRNLTVTAKLALNLDASKNPNQALDWFGVNFTNCDTIGAIKGYNNFLSSDGAFLNSAGLSFEGSIGTVGFSQCLFTNSTSTPIITIPATASITRRFRIIYSAFVITGAGGLSVDAAGIVNTESFILDTVNFSGGGTYLLSATHDSEKALFVNCVGVVNTGNIAHYFMNANATATTVAVQGTYYKVAGTTSAGPFTEKFTLSNNRATFTGSRVGFYKVTAVTSLTSGANNVITLRIAENGVTTNSSTSSSTTSPAGKSENIVCQDVVQLSAGDYIEIFVANNTSTTSITVEDLSVIVERLN